MPKVTVRQGRRYQALIRLNFWQSFADNSAVARKFEEVGFTEVSVSGAGRERLAKGLWPHPDATAELPAQIDPGSIREIEA
jgi:hypothetical protein